MSAGFGMTKGFSYSELFIPNVKVEVVLEGVPCVPTFGLEGNSRCLSEPSGAAAVGDENVVKDETLPMGLIGEFSEGFWLWFCVLALKPGALSALA